MDKGLDLRQNDLKENRRTDGSSKNKDKYANFKINFYLANSRVMTTNITDLLFKVHFKWKVKFDLFYRTLALTKIRFVARPYSTSFLRYLDFFDI